MLTCMNGNSDLNSRMLMDMNSLKLFALSVNGRLLVNVHESGELLMHNLEHHINDLILTKTNGTVNEIRRNKRGIPVANRTATVNEDVKEQQKLTKEKMAEIQIKVRF
jgi:hypothetical protein